MSGFWEGVGEFASGLLDGVAGASAPARGRIHQLCRQLGWGVDQDDGQRIRLDFNDRNAQGGLRQVYVLNGDAISRRSCA
jgi:hypothetical protein